MDGTKHQSLLQPTEESGLSIRALPSHDFCDSRLFITPSAYRFMSHEVKEVDGELYIFSTRINNEHYMKAFTKHFKSSMPNKNMFILKVHWTNNNCF